MSEPASSVVLALQVGEDWTQVLTFFDDPAPVPSPPVDPMELDSPVMGVKQTGRSTLLAVLNQGGTGLGGGTTSVGGTSGNQLTLTLPAAFTYGFQGMGTLSFDIFDEISSKRVAIVKSGIIIVTDAITPFSP